MKRMESKGTVMIKALAIRKFCALSLPSPVFPVHQTPWAAHVSRTWTFHSSPYGKLLNLKFKYYLLYAVDIQWFALYIHNLLFVGEIHTTMWLLWLVGNLWIFYLRVSLTEGRKHILFTIVWVLFTCSKKMEA